MRGPDSRRREIKWQSWGKDVLSAWLPSALGRMAASDALDAQAGPGSLRTREWHLCCDLGAIISYAISPCVTEGLTEVRWSLITGSLFFPELEIAAEIKVRC